MRVERNGKRASGWLAALLVFPWLLACADTTKEDPGGGNGGGSDGGGSDGGGAKAGTETGGTSRGGVAGSKAAGGTGGSLGMSGSGTTGGSAVSGSGSGGAPTPAGAECNTAEDCVVFDGCCGCSVGAATEPQQECAVNCIQSACSARDLDGATATCVSKRCVFDISCDRTKVETPVAAPACDAGQVPSVAEGGAWGPCVHPSECREVTDCDDCVAGSVCVNNSVFVGFIQCVAVTPECAESPTCECTDACGFQCTDENGIGCFCANC